MQILFDLDSIDYSKKINIHLRIGCLQNPKTEEPQMYLNRITKASEKNLCSEILIATQLRATLKSQLSIWCYTLRLNEHFHSTAQSSSESNHLNTGIPIG